MLLCCMQLPLQASHPIAHPADPLAMIPYWIENIHCSPHLQPSSTERPMQAPGLQHAAPQGASARASSARPSGEAPSAPIQTIMIMPPSDLPPSWVPHYTSGSQRTRTFILHCWETEKEMSRAKYRTWLTMQLMAVHPNVADHGNSPSIITARQLRTFIGMVIRHMGAQVQ